MKTYSAFASMILTEAIHKDIKNIMNDDTYNRASKLSRITKTLRHLSDSGVDSGIENSTPKKGSSRAVFFPKEHHELVLDGHPTKMKTAVKIAFKGTLDPHTGSDRLLGEHQNELESDHFTNTHYGIISHNPHTGQYHTNHESGVLAPVIDHHEDHHWVEHGFAHNMSKKDFSEATKTASHPKGLDFDKFHAHILHDYHQAHGTRGYSRSLTADEHAHIAEHPLADKVKDFMYTTGNHPGDLVKGNWGIFHHPVTGEKHPVIRDWGYNDEVGKLYNRARKNKYGGY